MKFLAEEYKSIQTLIKASSLSEEAFSFTKKRGKVIVQYLPKVVDFAFHRKDTTLLNANQEWEKATTYQVFLEDNQIKDLNWSAVKKQFEQWLQQL